LKEAVAPLNASIGSVLCDMIDDATWLSVTAHACPPSFAKFHHTFVVREEATDLISALAGHNDRSYKNDSRVYTSILESIVSVINASVLKEDLIASQITRVHRFLDDLALPVFSRQFMTSSIRFLRCLVQLQKGHHGPILGTLIHLGVPSDEIFSLQSATPFFGQVDHLHDDRSSQFAFSWQGWLQDEKTLLNIKQLKTQAYETRTPSVAVAKPRARDGTHGKEIVATPMPREDDILSLPDEIAIRIQPLGSNRKKTTWGWEQDILKAAKGTRLTNTLRSRDFALQGQPQVDDDIRVLLGQSKLDHVLDTLGEDVAKMKIIFDRRSQEGNWDEGSVLSPKHFQLFLLDLGFAMADERVRHLLEAIKEGGLEKLTWSNVLKLVDTFLRNDGEAVLKPSMALVATNRRERNARLHAQRSEIAVEGLSISVDSMGNGVGRHSDIELETDDEGKQKPQRQLSSAERAQIRKVFTMYDVNGDGVITYNDLRKTFENQGRRMNESELRTWIRSRDSTGQGQVSFADFCKSLEK